MLTEPDVTPILPAIGQLIDDAGWPLGTSFAVSPTHVVTDRHCLVKAAVKGKPLAARARVRFPADAMRVHEEVLVDLSLVDDLLEDDLALLKCAQPIPAWLTPLVPVAAESGDWSTIAWPDDTDQREVDGVRFTGHIRGYATEHDVPALELWCREAAAGEPAGLHGASGAPVLSVGLGPRSFVGVIRWNSESSQGAAIGGRVFASPAAVLMKAWAHHLPTGNPYKPPLTRYGPDESASFFGRDGAIEEAVRHLRSLARPTLTIWGVGCQNPAQGR